MTKFVTQKIIIDLDTPSLEQEVRLDPIEDADGNTNL